jgi:hypothetical protein
MAEYKGIKGFNVATLSSDPTNLSTGQIWYNTTSATLKGYASIGAAWSAGGDLNTGRGTGGAFGTTSAGMAASGSGPNPAAEEMKTETYDGNSWTQAANSVIYQKTAMGSTGTTTAALQFGGGGPTGNTLQSYNGTSWSDPGNDMNTARFGMGAGGGPGGQTSSIASGGWLAPGMSGHTETYNGSTWTEVNNCNTARTYIGSAAGAPQTTALMFGGQSTSWPATPNQVDLTELWDGTCWTQVNTMNEIRSEMGSFGISTGAMAVAGAQGYPASNIAKVEQYDGTSWTEVADVSAPRSYSMCSGSVTEGFSAGAGNPPGGAMTEEWADPNFSTVTFTAT